MKFFPKPVQRVIAKFLLLTLILPLMMVAILSVPVLADDLTKDDAYKGLAIALLLIVIAKVAKAIWSDADSLDVTPPSGYTAEDLDVLARVIHGEARGEPYIGQVAVGAVVLNRVRSASFPNTIYGVVYAANQFTSVSDGQINLKPNASAYKAAKEAIGGHDPTFGALFFYNPKTARNLDWFRTLTTTIEIGNHVFAK